MRVIEALVSRPLHLATLVVAVALAGCANTPNRAPVEERSATPRATVAAASPAVAPPTAVEPVKPSSAETGTRPGYYAVKPGDTLIRIGLDSGQNWKDLVRWNNLDNPNLIEVGQVLRVVAPGIDPTTTTSRPVTTARLESRPLESRPVPAAAGASAPAGPAASPAPAVAAAPPPAAVAAPAPAPAPSRDADDDITWAWPAAGAVATPFDEARNKGMVFRGKAGYGNLVILKHSPTYLTAYAHNQTLLVKDDQTVRRGQKIAEMGSTDADSVQLHFEIRKQGKPIDPARLLPPR
jgi:lipoprotein NlpD